METLTINGNVVLIKKLPLRKYPELLEVVQRIQKNLGTVTSTQAILDNLPAIISNNFADVAALVSIALEVPVAEVNEWGLDDFVIVITTFFEVNRFGLVYEQIKKVTARPAQPAAPQAQ